jgi:dipeptidyl aminopeptidase/acylaminoacyl peptidase
MVALQFGARAFRAGPLYWTSRGYAYVALDYRGSTCHGKAYREALYGKWGKVEVIDAVSVVDYLAARGDIDLKRVAIRGGSAGGFSVLAAVTQTDTFKTGTSMFPVVELASFRKVTHKFEAHYLDTLVGDGSDDAERSPLTRVDNVHAHLLFLQGGKDKICPPVETKRIVDALEARNRTAEYIEFADEYHGFVRAESIVESFKAEEAFNAKYLLPG